MLKLDFDIFEKEARYLTDLYREMNLRGGPNVKYNIELLSDIIDILSHWERVALLFDVDPMENNERNNKIMETMRIQVRALAVLDRIYEENYDVT